MRSEILLRLTATFFFTICSADYSKAFIFGVFGKVVGQGEFQLPEDFARNRYGLIPGISGYNKELDKPKLVYFLIRTVPNIKKIYQKYGFQHLNYRIFDCNNSSTSLGWTAGGDVLEAREYFSRFVADKKPLRKSNVHLVVFFKNLATYGLRNTNADFSWMKKAVENRTLCVRISTGTVGLGFFTYKVNISKHINFVYQ